MTEEQPIDKVEFRIGPPSPLALERDGLLAKLAEAEDEIHKCRHLSDRDGERIGELTLKREEAEETIAAYDSTLGGLTEDISALREAAEAALEHILDLEDAWRRGLIRGEVNSGGTRSNRNVDIRVWLSRVLAATKGKTDDN